MDVGSSYSAAYHSRPHLLTSRCLTKRCWPRNLQQSTAHRRLQLTERHTRNARRSFSRVEAATTLGSNSSIDFEEQEEAFSRSLIIDGQLEQSDAHASISGSLSSVDLPDPTTHDSPGNGSERSDAAIAAAAAAARRGDDGSRRWRLPPLPRWKQKRTPSQPARPSASAVIGEAVPPPTSVELERARVPARSLIRRPQRRKGRLWGPLAWLLDRVQARNALDSRGDYVKIDFRSRSKKEVVNPFKPSSWPKLEMDVGTFWGLLVLSLAYVHHSTTG